MPVSGLDQAIHKGPAGSPEHFQLANHALSRNRCCPVESFVLKIVASSREPLRPGFMLFIDYLYDHKHSIPHIIQFNLHILRS